MNYVPGRNLTLAPIEPNVLRKYKFAQRKCASTLRDSFDKMFNEIHESIRISEFNPHLSKK